MSARVARPEQSCEVLRASQGVEDARVFTEAALAWCDAAVREAASMVVAELAENIVKYTADDGPIGGTISLSFVDGVLFIRATNRAASEEDVACAARVIEELASSDNATRPYCSRMAALFRNEDLPRARLGLLRAAVEGGFRLSCTYERPTFTIVAQRPYEAAGP
jgi:hypothetical protein